MVGYEKQTKEIFVEPLQTTRISVSLKEETKRLREVVLSSGGTYKKDLPSPSLRLNQPLLEIPQNITIISKDLISDQQLLTLSEVERNVSGVTTNFPYPGIFTDFMIRGSRGTTNKFRNGIQSAHGTQLMEDMSFVENVEFVKGPAGFMISQGEPGGIYNVYTKKPVRNDLREISLSYGSFNLFRGAIDLGGSFKKDGKLLYRMNAMAQQSRTHTDYDYNNRYALAPVIAYEINNKTRLTAEYNFQHASLGIADPSIFGQAGFTQLPVNFTFHDPSGEGVKLTDHTFYLNLEHQINPDWKLTAQTGYSQGNWYGNSFDYGFSSDFELIDEAGNMYRTYKLSDNLTKSTSGQLFLNGNIKTGAVEHSLLAGLDANNYSVSISRVSGSVPSIKLSNPVYGLPVDSLPSLSLEGVTPDQESANYSALYVQDMITLRNDLRITLAGRYTAANILAFEEDAKTEQISAFTPRFGISYSVKQNLALYALYDQSFIPQTGQTLSGEKVKPLRGNNLEAGIKKDWFHNTLSTTLAVYSITKNNKLTADPLNTDYVIPRGEIQSKGLEFDMFGKVTKEMSLVFNYAYTDSKITEDSKETIKGQRVDGVAKHATNLWLKYQFQESFLKGFGIGFGGRYLADRAALTTYVVDVSENKFPVLDDWKQLDAALSYQAGDLRISLNVYNITNEKNYTGIPLERLGAFYTQYSPPVNYRISTSVKF